MATFTVKAQGCHEIFATKFHDFSMTFPWPYHKIPWPLYRHTCWLDFEKLPRSGADSWELTICLSNSMTFPWLFAPISKFHDFSMTLRNISQNSMTFPEIPENFKIPEIPWLFHDCGNPVCYRFCIYLRRKLSIRTPLWKADRPHLRYYLYTPPDYRHTDKHLRLVMTPNALCCTRQTTGQMDGRTLPSALSPSLQGREKQYLCNASGPLLVLLIRCRTCNRYMYTYMHAPS